MSAARHDFVVEQGTTWRRVLEYKNADGTVFVLTGWTASMQIRQRHTSAAPLLALTPTVVGAAGTVTMLITSAQTSALPTGRIVYDLELVAPSGEVTRLIEGSMLVDAEVTR